MPVAKVNYKDPDGFHYKYPERSCMNCKNYPCIADMQKLLCNFAAYGCKSFEDANVFEVWKPKR